MIGRRHDSSSQNSATGVNVEQFPSTDMQKSSARRVKMPICVDRQMKYLDVTEIRTINNEGGNAVNKTVSPTYDKEADNRRDFQYLLTFSKIVN